MVFCSGSALAAFSIGLRVGMRYLVGVVAADDKDAPLIVDGFLDKDDGNRGN